MRAARRGSVTSVDPDIRAPDHPGAPDLGVATTMRPRLRTVTAAFAAAGLLAACGNATAVADDPDVALTAAMQRTAAWDGATATVGFDFDEAELIAAGELTGDDAEVAHYLARSTLTVSSHPGGELEDTSDDVSHLALDIAGITAFELRAIRGDLYLRSDVRALVAEFAGDAETRAELEAGLAEATAQAEMFGVDVLADAIDGSWIHLQGHEQVGTMLEGMMGATPGAPDAADLAEMATQAGTAVTTLMEQVDVAYVADEETGDHLQVTTTGRALADAFLPLFETYAGMVSGFGGPGDLGIPTAAELESDPGFQQFAATTIPVEVWLADGELRQVGLDLIQLLQLNPELAADDEDAAEFAELDRFLIAVGLAAFDGELEAPVDAVTFDLFDVFGRMMSGGFRA